MNPVQQPLFQIAPQPYEVSLYHDVSGKYGQDRWIVWGYLFCKLSGELRVLDMLRKAKKAEGCQSPLHFADLPGGWGGDGKHKPRTAFSWLKVAKQSLGSDLWFCALALDTLDSGFDGKSFPRSFHLNNRFCRMGLTSAIAWFFNGIDQLSIDASFHRDSFEGGRPRDGVVAGEDCDNLGDYIVRETTKDAEKRHAARPTSWPAVTFKGQVKFLSIDPREEDGTHRDRCEFLQLADIVLGAVRQAIDGRSQRKTKRELASLVGEWAADTRKEPWNQKYGMHRRFILSYFPSPSGKVYTEGPLRLSARLPGTCQGQLPI